MTDERSDKSVFANDLCAGQTALVTGGGSGLGRTIARMFAEAGADVLLAARNVGRLDEVAEVLRRDTGRRIETAFVDIRDRDAVEALEALARDRFGHIDMLVNNAGGQFPQRARDFKPKGWKAVIDTNLTGTWNMTQVFGNPMLDRGNGSIVQIIAVVGRGFPGIAHSAAARAGVLELTKTLATEWGPDVRINCVAPGPVATVGFDGTYDERVTRKFDTPLGRFATPVEIANCVVFLASRAGSYVTGEVLYAAGGQQIYGRNQALLDWQLRGEEDRTAKKPAS